MASISLRKLVKRYGTGAAAVQVINGIDAEVSDGEFVVIVGPSGCGKSTLLRTIAGLESISEGRIRIAGSRKSPSSMTARSSTAIPQAMAASSARATCSG